MSPDTATIQALRSDMALQIARSVTRSEETQIRAARRLGIPQLTLSKIMRGKVSELSLELLIRIAVRAGLLVVLQTGKDPREAGVYLSEKHTIEAGRTRSKVAEGTRHALAASVRSLTPEQRLAAHVKHNELVHELSRAGRKRSRRTW